VGVLVAVQRVAAGEHFYTDVAAGFASGVASGVAVPLLHARF
jgi:membrane-associated phospholipid phosphatase